jgi:hypothetical protein
MDWDESKGKKSPPPSALGFSGEGFVYPFFKNRSLKTESPGRSPVI